MEHIILRYSLTIELLLLQVGDNDAAKVMNITSTFAGVAFESHQNSTPLKISKPSLGN